jgi:hypothetical protein
MALPLLLKVLDIDIIDLTQAHLQTELLKLKLLSMALQILLLGTL